MIQLQPKTCERSGFRRSRRCRNGIEDDIDDAKVILSIKTGSVQTYIILAIISIAILGGGTFLIKKYAGVKSGSAKGKSNIVGKLTKAQLKEIAEIKLPDLNAYDVEGAMKIVAGTAKNMGIEVE